MWENLQFAQLLPDAVARLTYDARLNVQRCQQLLQSSIDWLVRKIESTYNLNGQSWPADMMKAVSERCEKALLSRSCIFLAR